MPQFISAAEAVKLIRDGDCVIYNNFLGMNNAEQLSIALNERYEADGHPKDLTLYCTAGLGGWLLPVTRSLRPVTPVCCPIPPI